MNAKNNGYSQLLIASYTTRKETWQQYSAKELTLIVDGIRGNDIDSKEELLSRLTDMTIILKYEIWDKEDEENKQQRL